MFMKAQRIIKSFSWLLTVSIAFLMFPFFGMMTVSADESELYINLPDGVVGEEYNQNIDYIVGYDWSITFGELPLGLEIDSDSGTIQGIPTEAAEDIEFEIESFDSSDETIFVMSYTVTILSEPVVSDVLSEPEVLPEPEVAEVLPETGMLYVPIPLLVAFGLLMIIIGAVLNYKREIKRLKPKIFISFVGVLSILSSIGVTAYNHWDDSRAEYISAQTTQILHEHIEKIEIEEDEIIQLIEIDGDFYIGIINIPSQNLELPINNELSEEKLKNSPCRYTGYITGSIVIGAHNYKSQFGRIPNLKYGDKLMITDATGNEHWYTVELTEIIDGTDVESMINTSYDLTLFTCTMDSVSRITVRCTKIEEI